MAAVGKKSALRVTMPRNKYRLTLNRVKSKRTTKKQSFTDVYYPSVEPSMESGENMESSRKRAHPGDASSPHPVIKVERFDDDDWGQQAVSFDQGSTEMESRRGVVKCGHCKTRRASICCMEEACVRYAESKWKMTTMLICVQCDCAIHNNPVMTDHLRTPLLIRGLTYRDYEPPAEDGTNTVSAEGNEDDAEAAPGLLDSSIVISKNFDEPASEAEADGTGFVSDVNLDNTVDMNAFHFEEINSSGPISVRFKGYYRNTISLSKIDSVHKRYAHVLESHNGQQCTLTETFRRTGVPRQTLLDHVAIAELKIVDPERYDQFMNTLELKKYPSRIVDLEKECRRIVKEHCKHKLDALRGTKLLPLKLCVYN